jgi:hypothetical protein
VRSNTRPVFAGAGRKVIFTQLPVRNPIP